MFAHVKELLDMCQNLEPRGFGPQNSNNSGISVHRVDGLYRVFIKWGMGKVRTYDGLLCLFFLGLCTWFAQFLSKRSHLTIVNSTTRGK